MKTAEKRVFGLELRAEDGDSGPVIRGHVAVFDQLSDDLGGFREKIAPGAFSQTIQSDDIRALWNHNSDFVLARTRSGTLALREDETGLVVEISPPDTSWAKDALITIGRGDVSQGSFGFFTLDDAWEKEGGENIRTLRRVQLFDVSPVTFPAYPQTDVAMRSLEAFLEEEARALAPQRLRRRLRMAGHRD